MLYLQGNSGRDLMLQFPLQTLSMREYVVYGNAPISSGKTERSEWMDTLDQTKPLLWIRETVFPIWLLVTLFPAISLCLLL